MRSYKQLSAQIATLMQEAEAARKAEVAKVIGEIKAAMAEYGITVADLDGSAARGSRKGSVVAPKYRNPATGETWTGRGRKPLWLVAQLAQGRTRESFLI